MDPSDNRLGGVELAVPVRATGRVGVFGVRTLEFLPKNLLVTPS